MTTTITTTQAATKTHWGRPPATLGKHIFGSRQLNLAEMSGRAPKKSETARKRSKRRLKLVKNPPLKNAIFAPRTERAG